MRSWLENDLPIPLFLIGDLCETSSDWRVLHPISPTGETDGSEASAEAPSREGALCSFLFWQRRIWHKKPSLDLPSAASVSPVGEPDSRTPRIGDWLCKGPLPR